MELRKKASNIAGKAVVQAVEFIKKIKPNDKVVVINDDDCDGVCSGTILNIVLKEFCKSKPIQIPTEWSTTINKKLVKKILSKRPKYIIMSDVAYVDEELLEMLAKTSKVLIVDHHSVKKYKNVLYCNPRLLDADVYLPAAYLAYKIAGKLCVKNKKVIWIAAIGVLGDHGTENCTDLFVNLKKEFPDMIGNFELGTESLYQNSKLGLLTKIIDSGRVVKADVGAAHVAKVLLGAKHYKTILEGKTKAEKKLVGWYETMKKEFEELVGQFKEKSIPIGNTLFFEFKSKLKLKSSLANTVENFYDDKIIVVAQDEGKNYTISMRRGKAVSTDLDEFIRSAIAGIPNSTGGGHPQASGGRIPTKYKDAFKKNLA